ncbi:MAG: hypothetical protein ACTSQ4_02255 [Candidatus Heimdallarchaeaceae archaeon]
MENNNNPQDKKPSFMDGSFIHHKPGDINTRKEFWFGVIVTILSIWIAFGFIYAYGYLTDRAKVYEDNQLNQSYQSGYNNASLTVSNQSYWQGYTNGSIDMRDTIIEYQTNNDKYFIVSNGEIIEISCGEVV